MVSPGSAFWDSSSLIPLCAQQQGTQQVRELVRQFTPVVWWGTSVEIHSAIARLARSGHLDERDRTVALRHLYFLERRWREIATGAELRDLAKDLVGAHPLRAADSLQLAAALTWCQRRSNRRHFLSGDVRLCEAARAMGFSVIETS